jgi:serine/threonine-protein kinase
LIHRDVKPANVFCCRTGCQVDFVKVLDFGLVRHDRKQRTDEKDLTDEHIVGTPAFMAPEQAECRPGLDGRVDIYALGALGFWLLTGTHVFESETTVGMLVNLLKTPAGRVSERLGTPFPADLDDLLLSCLAKDPAQRPKSANALREGLLACDVPPWSQDDARAWWSERLPDAAPVDRDASTLAPLSVKFEP